MCYHVSHVGPTGWVATDRERRHDHEAHGRGAGQGRTSLAVPKGPRGEKRPVDTIGCAVALARIAVGELDDTKFVQSNKVRAGRASAGARTASLTPNEYSAIVRTAAGSGWGDRQ